ncbi:hypothetical protein [Nakamurella sp.]|uniref:hypothetical protein n=1 Tax=Nakamurella sp. TaxID=1869182 RepID=UPI003B3AC322
MTRPNLEGLFTGATPADPPMSWLNGTPAAEAEPPAPPAGPSSAAPSGPSAATAPPRRPAPAAAPIPPAATGQPTGLLDPIALAERYFTMMQALLDLQRDVGMRVAQQVAALPPLNRFRH